MERNKTCQCDTCPLADDLIKIHKEHKGTATLANNQMLVLLFDGIIGYIKNVLIVNRMKDAK